MPKEQPRTRWQTFAGWHREPSLWRELYARTVSALVAAFVIYVVAATSGVVSRRPLAVVFGLLTLLSVAGVARAVRRWRAGRRARALLPSAEQDSPEQVEKAGKLFSEVLFGLGFTVLLAVLTEGLAEGRPFWIVFGGG